MKQLIGCCKDLFENFDGEKINIDKNESLKAYFYHNNESCDYRDCEKEYFERWFNKKSNIFEVGCGSGRILNILRNMNYKNKYTGIEKNIALIRLLKQSYGTLNDENVIHSDFLEYKTNVKYDLVIMPYNLLSMIKNEEQKIKILSKAYDIVTDQGVLIFDYTVRPLIPDGLGCFVWDPIIYTKKIDDVNYWIIIQGQENKVYNNSSWTALYLNTKKNILYKESWKHYYTNEKCFDIFKKYQTVEHFRSYNGFIPSENSGSCLRVIEVYKK